MSDTFDHEGDAWASLDWDDPDVWAPHPKTCKYCGEKGFYWKQTPNGWRLAKKGEIHTCKLRRRKTKGMEP